MNDRRPLLPMLGHTRGKRSAVTCHLKCDDACAQPVPYPSDNPYFRDIAQSALARRTLFRGAGAAALTLVVGSSVTGAPAAAARPLPATGRSGGSGLRGGGLSFDPIDPVPLLTDEVTVPDGYRWAPIIRWGDPLVDPSELFDVTAQSPERQARQFGYNNYYLDIIPIPGSGDREALLVCNHEYTNPPIMFPGHHRSGRTEPSTHDHHGGPGHVGGAPGPRAGG
jgi:hypothetical protein